MNKILTLTVAALMAVAMGCKTDKGGGANTANDTVAAGTGIPRGDGPVLKLAEASHDFGSIKAGDKVEYTFEFTNTGKTPLQIVNAVASCGCTVPEYPTRPVLPGEKGKMVVRFNSEGKEGMQDKVVTIYSNGPTEQLHILANIK